MTIHYIVNVYEPCDKAYEVEKPFYADSLDEVVAYIQKVRRKRGLHYMDLLVVNNGLHRARFSNEIDERELRLLVENLKNEVYEND